MRLPVLRRAAQAALALCVLGIAYLAFAPLADPPGFSWDKTNHVLAFVTLAALADIGWPGPRARPWRLGLVLGYGLFIELVQTALDYRHGSALDFAADALGVLLWLGLKRAASMMAALRRPALAEARRTLPTEHSRNAAANRRNRSDY